jgi:hypothetical protein
MLNKEQPHEESLQDVDAHSVAELFSQLATQKKGGKYLTTHDNHNKQQVGKTVTTLKLVAFDHTCRTGHTCMRKVSYGFVMGGRPFTTHKNCMGASMSEQSVPIRIGLDRAYPYNITGIH